MGTMTGYDVMCGAFGVAAIIIALAVAAAIPQALRMIERIATHDPKAPRRQPPLSPTDRPWDRL